MKVIIVLNTLEVHRALEQYRFEAEDGEEVDRGYFEPEKSGG